MAVWALVAVSAAIYASVGHGGASAYLAILSLYGVAPAEMSTSALLLNILVAGVALVTYARAGHLSARLTWPFHRRLRARRLPRRPVACLAARL